MSLRRIWRRVNSDKYGFKSLGCGWVTFFIGIVFEIFVCTGYFNGSVIVGGIIVVTSIEVVVVVLLNSLKFDSYIGFVIMVVVSIANVVGIVVVSPDSVANSCGTDSSAFAVLLGVSAFGGGSFTRDISILTPPSTVPNVAQQ